METVRKDKHGKTPVSAVWYFTCYRGGLTSKMKNFSANK